MAQLLNALLESTQRVILITQGCDNEKVGVKFLSASEEIKIVIYELL